LKDTLRLLECGVIRLLGEYGETVLAYAKSTSLLKKLLENPKSVDLHAIADLKMLSNVLEKHFRAEKDDIELPFQPCYAGQPWCTCTTKILNWERLDGGMQSIVETRCGGIQTQEMRCKCHFIGNQDWIMSII
jgi:hypothetical protein